MKKKWIIAAGVLIALALAFLLFANRLSGQEELMLCDGCQRSLQLDYADGRFTAARLHYEWEE